MGKLWLWLIGEVQPKEVWLAGVGWAGKKSEGSIYVRAGEDRYPKINWATICHPSSKEYWMINRYNTRS